jgi:hypothetical protein
VASLPLGIRCLVLSQAKTKASAREVEQQLVELTNSARQSEGLSKLFVNPSLTDVAREHAKNIATMRTDYEKPLEEQWRPEDKWMQEQLKLSGYGWPVMQLGVLPGLFKGDQLSPAQAFAGWLGEARNKTKPQERGVLSPYYADVGIGVHLDENTGIYYVAFVFAKRFKPKQNILMDKDKEKDKDP